MHKFAATVLALALATNHGLLDEGGHVQKKDASKGLRGNSAKADSSLERAAVGRKLEFGYTDDVGEPTPTPTVAPTSSVIEFPTGRCLRRSRRLGRRLS